MKLFDFDKDVLRHYIEYDLRTTEQAREPMNFIIAQMVKQGHSMTLNSLDKKIDLNKVKERKGKNYNWSVFVHKNATMLVRRYKQHLTIFTKVFKDGKYPKTEYGAFTMNTDMDKFGAKHDQMMDKYWDNPFIDLNAIIKNLMEVLMDRGVHWVWNSACLKRPNHVDIKLAYCDNNINSIDDFVYCMEEISSMYQELFAETIVVKRLKELKVGERLTDEYTIGVLNIVSKDGYFHVVGAEFINQKKKSWNDVYCLARYYMKDLFKTKLYFHGGEVYVEGGTLKIGSPAAYANFDTDVTVTIYQKDYPKENFKPLKKY